MAETSDVLSGRDPSEIDWDQAARRIRFLIETHHLTIPDVAFDLGVSQVTLQEILDGQARASEYLIVAASNYFGVTVDFLLSDQTTPPRKKRPASPTSSSSSPSSAPSIVKKSAGRSGATVGDLAVRHQALVELLIEKGVIQASELNAAVDRVEFRKSQRKSH